MCMISKEEEGVALIRTVESDLRETLSTQTAVLKVVRAPCGTDRLSPLPLRPSSQCSLEATTRRQREVTEHMRTHVVPPPPPFFQKNQTMLFNTSSSKPALYRYCDH